MNLQEVLERRRKFRQSPTEEEERHLPFRRAFVYGRVSNPDQIRDSEQSIKEIAHLVALARGDGYNTILPQEEVDGRIQAIWRGKPGAMLVWEDGDVFVDCRDLGLSGQLPEEKRPGLANLKSRLQSGEVGCLYLTEGMSRLSRDRDRIISHQMLKLIKEEDCRVRTPDGLWNPAIERDWDYLHDELEDAAQELKVMGKRLRRRRDSKAREGRHVGCPVVAGFIVQIEGQRPDGRYILGKLKAYPPHAEVDNLILRKLVELRSPIKAAQALHKENIVFPFFPPELTYMVSRTELRVCPRTPTGYAITPALVSGLAQNPKLIGVWSFSNQPPIVDNHDHVVSEDLFQQAYEVVKERKPRGKAVQFDPLPFSGLLWCVNHPVPRLVSSHSSDGSYVCNYDYLIGQGPGCMDITSYVLDIPLLEVVLRQLDFTPYADEVLTKLEAEYDAGKTQESYRKRQEAELEQRIKQLKGYLGSNDPEREETYWSLIREAQAQLDELRAQPVPRMPRASLDIHLVRNLLARIKVDWESFSSVIRNRLLHIFLERVEIRPGKKQVEATIIWKTGLRQSLVIERPEGHGGEEKAWTPEEKETFRLLWPSAAREDIETALPRRTWRGIALMAHRLGIKRPRTPHGVESCRPWSAEEDARLLDCYNRGDALAAIGAELGRSFAGVACRIQTKGLRRPRPKQKNAPVWRLKEDNLIGSQPFCRDRG
jgi:hypothetical protein